MDHKALVAVTGAPLAQGAKNANEELPVRYWTNSRGFSGGGREGKAREGEVAGRRNSLMKLFI